MRVMTRGQLARHCGLGIEAIRFYEKRGLLPPPRRSASGYRHYDDTAVARLTFIQRAKELGFGLGEIKLLLALHEDSHTERAKVKGIAGEKLAEIDQKINDLKRIREALSVLHDACSGTGTLDGCPIIEALAGREKNTLDKENDSSERPRQSNRKN